MEQLILGYHVLPTLYILLESLRKKVIKQEEDDFPFPIIDLDLYSGDPWDVLEDDVPWVVHNHHHQLSSEVKRAIYVFTELKFSGCQRYVRTAGNGTWDGATGDVEICENGVLIGTMKYLNFKLKGERDEDRMNGHWTMYEYKLAGEMLIGLENISLATTLVLCEITQIVDKSLRIHVGWTKSIVDNYFDLFAKRGFFQKANNVDDGYDEFRTMTKSTNNSNESTDADKSRTSRDTNDRTNSSDVSVADKFMTLTMPRDTNDRIDSFDESLANKSRTLTMAQDTNDRTDSFDESVDIMTRDTNDRTNSFDDRVADTMARDTNDRTDSFDESVADKSMTILTMAQDNNDIIDSFDESVADKSRILAMAQDTSDRTGSFDDSVADKSRIMTMARENNDVNGITELERMLLASMKSNGDEANISRRNAPWVSMSVVDPTKHHIVGTKARNLHAFPRSTDGPLRISANGVGKTGQLRKKICPGFENRAADGSSRISDENLQIRKQNYSAGAHGHSRVLVENVQLPKQIYPRDVAGAAKSSSIFSANGAKTVWPGKRNFQGDVLAKVSQQVKRDRQSSPGYFLNNLLR